MIFDWVQRRMPATARLLAVSALTMMGLACSPPASAEEDTNMLNSMMGLFGMQSGKEAEGIDYRPRAPLVVPPRKDLPEPKEAKRDPAWPNDPDTIAQRRAALDSRRPAPQTQTNKGGELATQDLPSNSAGGTGNAPPTNECEEGKAGTPSCLFMPWKMLEGAFKKSDTVQPGVEPQRRLLTEPPVGYRNATAPATATADPPKARSDATDPGSLVRANRLKTSVAN